MSASNTCIQCGTALPPSAPQGLCPRCLLGMGLDLFPAVAVCEEILPPEKRLNRNAHGGDYEFLEEIARGGMGVVFKARQISLDRTVAVKALLFGEFASDEFVSRFREEARAASSLRHPNIVSIHEVWEEKGQHFFSMEYVYGPTLGELLRAGPLPCRRAARYAKIISQALDYAHERGVLHRDLKPSNVLIDEFDQPRITDFGLAKRIGPEATHTPPGQIMGSPQYMSPEQAGQNGGEAGPCSDVYSIGALLYHMITGRPPATGETIEEILMQTLQSEPIAPRVLNGSVPRDLETICLKCLQKEPRRRYPSARAVAEDLERLLEDKPILARPAGVAEKSIRWCRRNPAPTAILALLAVLATLSTWGSIYTRRLNQEVRINAYVSDMNVAFRHWEEGDVGHALEILKRNAPERNELDLRGFEWRHLWWLCRGNFRDSLPIHPQVVGQIYFSNDGKKLLTHAWNNTARLYDIARGQNLTTITNVLAVGGFLADDRVLMGRTDGTLQWLGPPNRALANVGELIAFAPGAEIAATLDESHLLRAWNTRTGGDLLSVPDLKRSKTEYGWNSSVVLSPDGSKMALIQPEANPLRENTRIRIWNLADGTELPPLIEKRVIRCVAFSPDGGSLVSGDGDGVAAIWNLATGESKKITAHSAPILSLAFSPDGKTFATGSADRRSIRLWDLATGLAKPGEFRGQAGDVWSLSFSPDGRRLASGTRDDLIRIWNLDDVQLESGLERLNADDFFNIAFSPDGTYLACGCRNNTVKIWNVRTMEVAAVIPRASYVVAFSADGRRILVSSQEGGAFWWNFANKSAQAVPGYDGNPVEIISVAMSPDRKIAALGLVNGGIRLLDVDSGRPVGPLLSQHSGPVRSVAFSPGGDQLASGGSDKKVMMWNVKTGAALGMCSEHKGGVFGVTISPDGKIMASGCGAETVKMWDTHALQKGAWASASYHKSVVRSLSFSPDNRTLASGSEDRTVKLWNSVAFSKTTSRREVGSFSFDDPVRCVLFAPDGNTLAVVTDKGTARLLRAVSLEEADQELRNR